ncbi:Protein of unknown function C-terminus (DUF2399) [Streptomyces sp. SceaMP-e96]|nr:DUF2399 domain-containing protein [Streptomyces sp. SID4951]SCK56919.1 Protein of unknown function C-terminus (DUF2399) [Streptomyces sp. SceaMP-e96]
MHHTCCIRYRLATAPELRKLQPHTCDAQRICGDFDWPGVTIAEQVLRLGARPWRMSAADYLNALAELPTGCLASLTGDPVATLWDPHRRTGRHAGHQVSENHRPASLTGRRAPCATPLTAPNSTPTGQAPTPQPRAATPLGSAPPAAWTARLGEGGSGPRCAHSSVQRRLPREGRPLDTSHLGVPTSFAGITVGVERQPSASWPCGRTSTICPDLRFRFRLFACGTGSGTKVQTAGFLRSASTDSLFTHDCVVVSAASRSHFRPWKRRSSTSLVTTHRLSAAH